MVHLLFHRLGVPPSRSLSLDPGGWSVLPTMVGCGRLEVGVMRMSSPAVMGETVCRVHLQSWMKTVVR